VPQHRRRQVDQRLVAVLAHQLAPLPERQGVLVEQLRVAHREVLGLVRVEQIGDALAAELAARILEDLGQRPVGAQQHAVQIRQRHADRGRGEDLPEQRLARLEVALDVLLGMGQRPLDVLLLGEQPPAHPIAEAGGQRTQQGGEFGVRLLDAGQLRQLAERGAEQLDRATQAGRLGEATLDQAGADVATAFRDQLGSGHGLREHTDELDQLTLDLVPRPRHVDNLRQCSRPLPGQLSSIHRRHPWAKSLRVLLGEPFDITSYQSCCRSPEGPLCTRMGTKRHPRHAHTVVLRVDQRVNYGM
jgi:hypothetical protein